MDRQIPVSNRYIDRKMKEMQQKKHRQTLYNIKVRTKSINGQSTFFNSSESQPSRIVRHNSSFQENKNLQIQRQNIKLFNKIANIIREKPKNGASRSYAKSIEESAQKLRKKQDRLKTENEEYEKRILKQRSSIQNKLLFKDRQKNLKYLKFIGRYPYDPLKKSEEREETQINSKSVSKITTVKTMRQHEYIDEVEVYRKRTQDAFIRIVKICNSYYIFYVQIEGKEQPFKYTMPKNTYEQELQKLENSIDKLVGKLRLTEDGTMIFQYS